ncbi:BREX system ATP-binding domain-containing protein [Streptosporangium sp. NPDC049046]|uniref:BREX system ATP-binding domain-containing protein n=1 Tax=unclassified Streptosporangium TaxID=2632669 RepID=UPI003414BFB5
MVTMSGRIFHGEARPVGREAEFRTLVSWLEGAAEGEASLTLLRGPTGSGKTSLLEALERYARSVGVTILRGSCSPAGARLPWSGAESLFGGAPLPTRGGTVPLSHLLFRRVGEAAVSGPVALMLDDTQWCDEESLAWLDFLVNRGHHLPLFVLLAQHRSGPSNGRAVPGVAARGHRVVDLGPLSEEDAGKLARRCWETVPKELFVRLCTSVCRGNLALLARLFKRLSEEGVPPDARGESRAAELGAELHAGHLLATLDRRPAYVRGVVEAFAVLGHSDAELVGMLAGVPEPLVTAAIEILRDEEIIDVGLAELNERHVRTAVLNDMPTAALDRRRELAARLLNDGGRPAEEVSAQLALLPALPETWMRGVLGEGARRAESNGDAEVAAHYLGRMVMADPADVGARADLARLIGHDDPARAYAMLCDGLRETGDVRGRARLAIQMSRVAPPLGREPEVVSTLNAVLAELDGAATGDHESRMLVESALLLIGWNRRSTAKTVSEWAVMSRTPGVSAGGGRELLAGRSLVFAMSGFSSRTCLPLARKALSGPDEVSWSQAVGAAAYVLSLADEVEEAVRAMGRVISHGAEQGDTWGQVMALSRRSWILGEAGNLDGALVDAIRAMKLADEQPWSRSVTAPRTALGAVLAWRGDLGQAAAVLGQLGTPDVEDYLLDYPRVLMTKSYLAASRGDHASALSSLTECGALLAEAVVRHPMFVPWWLEAACLLAELGRGNEAGEFVEHGEELAEAWGNAPARGLALLARGAVAEGVDGVETLTEAVETLTGTQARWYLVRAESLLGEALLRMDDREGARGHFRRAVHLSVRCGFRRLAEQARGRLVAAGGRMYQGAGGVKNVLTTGEGRVAELAATGATNQEIAQALRITLRTVESHLTSVFRKLDVSGRADLGWALETLPTPSPNSPADSRNTMQTPRYRRGQSADLRGEQRTRGEIAG